MVDVDSRLPITGANGQLSRLVIGSQLKTVPPSQILCADRDADRAAQLNASGLEVCEVEWEPTTLRAAFDGIHKALLISSNEVVKPETQHRAVIQTAKWADVKLHMHVLHSQVKQCDRPLLRFRIANSTEPSE